MRTPAADVVEDALERLLASPQFTGSPRASRFLQFVVEAALGWLAGLTQPNGSSAAFWRRARIPERFGRCLR